MKTAFFAAVSSTALIVAGSPALAQQPTTTGGAAQARAAGSLEDIVVTAQRREENLQKVPVAVTALSASALDEARITNVQGLSGYAPNVQLLTQGVQSIPTILIRGISSGVSDNAVDPKIGIYLDGVYIGRSVGAIFDLADLERVEILRGPQGTLFGRNSTGGAISLVSAAPTGEFGVRQTLSYGNYKALRSRTTLNLPAFGPLALKVSYLHDEIDGYARNLIGGQTIDFSLREPGFGPLTYAKSLGKKNVDAVQVAARIDASDALTIDYRFDYTDSKTTAFPMQLLGTTADGGGLLAGGVLQFQPLTGGIVNLGRDPLKAVANGTSLQELTVEGHNLTIQWAPDDLVAVKSITAYRKFKQKPNIHDLGSTGGWLFTEAQFLALLAGNIPAILDPANQPGPNDRFYNLLTARSTSQKQFTQEVQVIFDWDRFDLTSGVFYFHENSPALNVLGIFQPVRNGVVVPNPFLDATFGNGVTETRAINDSIAGYAQMTWHATDTLDLTFGGRYTIDDRSTKLIQIAGAAAGDGEDALVPGRTYKTSYTKFNYTAIVTYRPTEQVTAYGKVATGYVAGGILGAIAYDPENLTSYEEGVKSQLLDNRLRANVAAFWSDYKDLQTQTFVGGVQRFQNAGKARVWGFEGEFDFVPFGGLSLQGNVGYTDFKYKEYMQNGVNVADIVKAIYIPKWTARFGGQYDFPEMSSGANIFLSADARYRSSVWLTAFSTGSPALDAQTKAPGFTLIDARGGVANLPLGGAVVEVSGWVKNVFNKDNWTFGPTAVNQVIQPNRGRTYGIDLALAF